MTPEQRDLVLDLCKVPGGPEPLSEGEFLQRFGAQDGVALGLDMLADARDRRDPIDVEMAMIVGDRFGFSGAHLGLLVELAYADWHEKHEDVAAALQMLRAPQSVDALEHLAEWIPAYLEWDENRALATKALWALGAVANDSAKRALENLARSSDPIVARGARDQLARLTGHGTS